MKNILLLSILFILLLCLFNCPVELVKNTSWKGKTGYNTTVTDSIYGPMTFPQTGKSNADIISLDLKSDGTSICEMKITDSTNASINTVGCAYYLDGSYTADNDGNFSCSLNFVKSVYPNGSIVTFETSGVKANIDLKGKLDLYANKGNGTVSGSMSNNTTGTITGSWELLKK